MIHFCRFYSPTLVAKYEFNNISKLVYSYQLMVYLKVRAMKFTALLDLPKHTGLNFHLSSPLLSFHPRYEIHQSQIPYAHY